MFNSFWMPFYIRLWTSLIINDFNCVALTFYQINNTLQNILRQYKINLFFCFPHSAKFVLTMMEISDYLRKCILFLLICKIITCLFLHTLVVQFEPRINCFLIYSLNVAINDAIIHILKSRMY